MTVLVLVVTHVLAVALGALLGFRWFLLGDTHRMRITRLLSPARRAVRSSRFGVGLVTAALLVNALLGFLLILTRADIQAGERRDDARLSCQIRYNTLKGEALTSRDAVAKQASAVERKMWERIRSDLERGTLTGEGLTDAIGDYLRQLDRIAVTRIQNPYPANDLCEGVGQ